MRQTGVMVAHQGDALIAEPETPPMKYQLIAAATLAMFTGAASAQPPGNDGPQGRGPGGFGLLEFDTNADGKLTKAEFDASQRARFNKIDANKDGTATREEFEAARKIEAESRRAEISKVRFAELDKDKSGQISQAEFAAGSPGRDGRKGPRGHGHAGHGPGFGPDANGPDGVKKAGRRDADSDGKVTFAEFSARGIDAFNRADANKDGTITVGELQALKPNRS